MSTNSALLIIEVPVALTRPIDEIISRSSEIGRNSGLDDDWTPACLEEAIYEILISAGSEAGCRAAGVTFRPDLLNTAQAQTLFCLRLHLLVTEDEAEMDDIIAASPNNWPRTLEAGCLAVLMMPVPPLDFNIEIMEYRPEEYSSQHERMQRQARIIASQALGATPD